MSNAVPLYGFGSGGNSLGIKVVSGKTRPSSPKEYTIWVDTSLNIPAWEMGVIKAPTWSMETGFVYFTTVTADSSAEFTFNLLKKNSVFLRTILAIQNQGIAENPYWVPCDAYLYKNGEWLKIASATNIPAFTYTGDYEIVNDDDVTITTSQDNWKIRFLTSGTLTIQILNGATDGIDVFCVGGGGGGGSGLDAIVSGTGGAGGGGGGGYVTTQKEVPLTQGTAYAIVVGSGGNGGTNEGNGADGGTTTAFGLTAKGGDGGKGGSEKSSGGAGTGSGGKGVTSVGYSGGGAVAGEDGVQEFGETTSKIYYGAGGGGGGQNTGDDYGLYPSTAAPAVGGKTGGGDGGTANTIDTVTDGQTNTGAGGGGGGNNQESGNNGLGQPPGGDGGSGIVIIRNARKEETA